MDLFIASVFMALMNFFLWSPPSNGGAPRDFRIVVLGDSVSQGLGVDQTAAWPSILEKRLHDNGHPEAKIINASVSGSTSASATSRLRWLLKNRIDLLVIALGGNDGLRGVPPATTKSNLSEAIASAKAAHLKVLIAGMLIPPNYGTKYTQEFRDIYPQLAKQHDVPIIPFLLEGVGGEKKLNQADGIHPNEAGHTKIANHVYPYVVAFLRPVAASGPRK